MDSTKQINADGQCDDVENAFIDDWENRRADDAFRDTEEGKLARERGKFTARKLTWMAAMMADTDPKLSKPDKLIGICVMEHVNWQTGEAYLSDEVIAEKTGGGSTRNIRRSRKRLKAKWLTWRSTRTKVGKKWRTVNVYKLKYDRVSAMFDAMTVAREARKERQAAS